ncbi:hypothetical protein OPKNFCMD_3032 [Methylobacterium crusticola]|uniref:Polysaccharide chain length determinant N-terminal domain-containing protein n=1 Tax=Methylobacterium crusticola TaxID=1697972 RepID=A0ABQ4QYB2_9HYPH|nr:Wzz/FepE/Etk N-terminal domain-containing protein [Methylobacterium crusticola]GJD50293.1 hypothetical protein OPKNFCMD_3032 [Methylobacterium crusticola]
MLNNPIWTDPSLARHVRDDAPEGRALEVRDVLAFFRRRRARILACALAGAALGGLYTQLTPALYTARAQLVIDSKMPPLFAEPGGDPRAALDTGQIANQVAILKSEKVALMVIGQLGLRNDPEFGGAAARRGSWLWAVQERLAPVLAGLRSLLHRGDSDADGRPGASLEAERALIDTFNARLDIRRSGIAYALDIAFTSRDPQKAATIVNTVVEAFLREKMEARVEASRFATDWLNERVDRFRAQMNAAIRAVQEFRATHNYRIRRRSDRREEADASGGGQAAPPRVVAPADDEPGTLEELESAAETSRKVYESLLVVMAEAMQRQSAPVLDSRVITTATRPLHRSSPGLRITVPAGAAAGAGLFIGIGLAGLLLDGRTRTRRQLRSATGRDCIGWITRRRPRWGRVPAGGGRQGLDPAEQARLCAGLVDGLQWTRLALTAAGHAAPVRSIGLAAAVRPSGPTKAMAAVELARLYAAAGSRTLIVDAEITDPVISRTFAPDAVSGLFEAMSATGTRGPVEFGRIEGRAGEILRIEGSRHEGGRHEGVRQESCRNEAWRRSVVAVGDGCDLLPLVLDGPAPSLHWLGSPAMEALLTTLLGTYDVLIVDLPPVGATPGILALAPLLDGVVMVAEWGRTSTQALGEACATLEQSRARILGSVMTEADPGATNA